MLVRVESCVSSALLTKRRPYACNPSKLALIIHGQNGLLQRLHKCVQILALQYISMAQFGIRNAPCLAKPLHVLRRAAHILGSLPHAEPCVRRNRWLNLLVSVPIHVRFFPAPLKIISQIRRATTAAVIHTSVTRSTSRP